MTVHKPDAFSLVRRFVVSGFPRAVALVLLIAIAACERSPASPRGSAMPTSPSKATAAAQPIRLVALSPALAITLRDLGFADLIVGRHQYDFVLDKSIPICGDQTNIDYEALLAAEPTHVELEWGKRDLPQRLRDLAASHGWTLKTYSLLTLDEVEACAKDLHATLRTARGDPRPWESTELALSMAKAWSKSDADLSRAGRVLLLASVDPPGLLGPTSFHHQILTRLGATPAITEGGPWQNRDAEDILRIAPDSIIVFRPRPFGTPPPPEPSPEELIAALGRVGTLDLPAIRAKRVALIDDPLGLTPSSAMVGVAERMDAILTRWAREGH
jgi:ABC-type Fe3+-hydroxamate transport system substrate-binding protein